MEKIVRNPIKKDLPGFYAQVKKIILLIISLIITCCSFAQEYSYVHYDTRDGLAGSVVYCMVQDKDGFIWFGTETGLSRFDGGHFTNFTSADGLPDNEILKLFVDSKNRVWIIPFNNATCYYWKGRIHTATNDSLLRRLQGKSKIQSIKENGRGEVAFQYEKDLKIILPDNRIIEYEQYKGKLFVQLIKTGISKNGNFESAINIANKDKLTIFEIVNDSLVINEEYNNSRNITNNNTYLSADLRVINQEDTLNFYLLKKAVHFKIKLPDGFLNISRLSDSTLTIISTAYVQVYNFLQQQKGLVYLPGKDASEVMEDSEGNVWFSSLGKGVYRLVSTEFKNIVFEYERNALPVSALEKAGDTLYIGTDHFMLWSYNKKTGALRKRILSTGS